MLAKLVLLLLYLPDQHRLGASLTIKGNSLKSLFVRRLITRLIGIDNWDSSWVCPPATILLIGFLAKSNVSSRPLNSICPVLKPALSSCTKRCNTPFSAQVNGFVLPWFMLPLRP